MRSDSAAQVSNVWCTDVDLAMLRGSTLVSPRGPVFDAARVLVRLHGEPLLFVQRPLVNGAMATADLLDELSDPARARLIAHLEIDGGRLGEATPAFLAGVSAPQLCPHPDPTVRTVTVVVCTRGRGQELRGCLAALKQMRNERLDFIIVDNAPTDDQAAVAFEAEVGGDPRFRLVVEPRAGLSCARNRGLAEATGEVIAFTDDDVRVDAGWVGAILAGFDRRADVACVTSLVCTASLRTPAEHYFDARVSWAVRCEPRVYDQTAPENDALYPYSPGLFGTGAGMAFRTSVIRELGGFDEALGAGTRTAGGEDLDAFVRVIRAGQALAYEPSSLVWHCHRSDLIGLRKQMYAYGTGLTAFITKHLLDRSTRAVVLRRIPRGVAKLVSVPKKTQSKVGQSVVATRSLLLREFAGMAMGPVLFRAARRRISPASVDAPAGETADRARVAGAPSGSVVTAPAPTVGAAKESTVHATLACVILTHTDPLQVRRLIAALDPFPVFLHCDARTPDDVFAAMVADLPVRCAVLERISTDWAMWGNVAAELAGYRAALDATDATHVAVLSGADYPLASTAEISATLEGYPGRSIASIEPLPYPQWGRSGGFDRLRYRHWAYRRHMLRLPVPRRLPADVVPAGGSALKILARDHARAVVDAANANPALVRFWRRSWAADESFVPTVLSTPRFVPGWSDEHVKVTPWWIGWDGPRRKSPPWLGMEHLDQLLTRQTHPGDPGPLFFARKFSTAHSTDVLDAIDSRLRNEAGSND